MFKKAIGKIKVNRLIRKKNNLNEKIKLHIGCGTNYFDGWINIDNNSDNNIKKLDINWDLRKGLPFYNNSVDFIYNEHFLEHLTVKDGQRALKEFIRVLKPNGVLRIAMPDIDWILGFCDDPEWHSNPFLKKYGLDFIKTKAEFLNINFRWWGHQWLYSWEELERRLQELGCKNIKKCEFRESYYMDLQNLETREESTLIVEVVKE